MKSPTLVTYAKQAIPVAVAVFFCGAFASLAQSPPPLRVDFHTQTQVGLSWLVTTDHVVLEATETLAPGGAWRQISQAAITSNGSFHVTVDLSGASRFFRLHRFETNGLPPDPAAVAPPLAPDALTPLAERTAFLYTGPSPVQTGVSTNAIQPKRAAVVRGHVRQRDQTPLPGVTISILHHPELGQTLSRVDGQFDLVVNGGGPLVVNYTKTGYLTAQRRIEVPWQDFATVEDVVLVPVDPAVTPVALGLGAPAQLHRGSRQTDAEGSRQATLLIPPGASAELVLPDGTTQAVTSLSLRATEYTVGDSGPEAMPAELPPTSAYTYCVELSADEAMATGAKDVRFGTPLPFYVENFLNFPVGTSVPVGSYDRTGGTWIPEPSGKVIKLLGVTAGAADLDTDGNGVADDAVTLAALSITDIERQQLATLYSAGQSLWRVLIPHFTPWDANWPYGLPDGAQGPDQDPQIEICMDGNCQQSGNSIIECENQILGEEVPVVGTPFGLHYSSQRVPGRNAANTLEIPLTGDVLPPDLAAVRLEVHIAGQTFRQSFPRLTNQTTTFTWDGLDAYGRRLHGQQRIVARIGYVYPARYAEGPTLGFGAPGTNFLLEADPARQLITVWRVWEEHIGTRYAQPPGLGGWTLSPHHTYFPNTQELWRGDGTRETVRATGPLITTYAGTGVTGQSGDGGPAINARLHTPQGLAFGPDGSLYVSSLQAHLVRRIDPNGIISTVVSDGSGNFCQTPGCGDGGPATQARLVAPRGLAVGPDGSLFVVEVNAHRVRKVRPDGIITTIAGTGVAGFSGDGGPAGLAQLNTPQAVAVGPDGSVYISDQLNARIRRISPAGVITTFAGGGSPPDNLGDGLPATQARMQAPSGLAVGQDGSVYLTESGSSRVRRITPDGIIRTVAGNGTSGFSGDGFPATQAQLSSPQAVAVGPDDTVYVVDAGNRRLRWFRPGGPINTLAGTGVDTTLGDFGPARAAALQSVDYGIAVGPDGAVYVAQAFGNVRIRRIAPLVDRFVAGERVPSADGSEVYVFTPEGRHLRTVDSLTGVVTYEFGYDGANRLVSITDRDTNITRIEWGALGKPLAIEGPFGQRTVLDTDTNGWLARIENPAGEVVQLNHDALGLLKQVTQPGGQTSRYTYDLQGRLASATDPTGAIKHLDRMGSNNNYTVTLTTHLGRTTTYRVRHLPNGDTQRITTDCGGGTAQVLVGSDGRVTATEGVGITRSLVLGPDPRWGMRAPITASLTTVTPGRLTNRVTMQRTVVLEGLGDPLLVRSQMDILSMNGRSWTNSYTRSNSTALITSPAGRRAMIQFDAKGRPAQSQQGDREPVALSFDPRGRLVALEQGQGPARWTNRFAYRSDGSLASLTDALGQETMFTNDTVGRLTAQVRPDGAVLTLSYDVNGNVRGLAPPGRPEHGFAYTVRDEVARYAPPLVGGQSNATLFTYDADRRATRIEYADGGVAQFTYAGTSCQLSLADLDNRQRSYGYDAAGRLISLSSSDGVALQHAYDGKLLTNVTWSGVVGGSVSRTFDHNLRVTSLRVSGGNPINIQYDSDDFPTQVGDVVLTRSPLNGTITGTRLGSLSDSNRHDGFGATTNYTAHHAGNLVYAADFTRDALGRISRKTETMGTTTRIFDYSYDSAGRLVEVARDGVVAAIYTYDGNGNRLTRTDAGGTITAATDAQDQLLQHGTTTYQHNANGERVAKVSGAQTTVYRYERMGGLVGVTLPDGRQIDYLLDAQDRRTARKVNGTMVQAFLYLDSLRPAAELDGSGAVVSEFVYASDRMVPDYLVKNGATYRIITDHLGSPRLVLDVTTGQVVQQMDHDEFGRVILDTNPGFQPFGFAGGLYDRDTGLIHFGAREYDPETGRWLTKDPIRFAGGDANLFAYCGNDPVNRIDPLGLAGGEIVEVLGEIIEIPTLWGEMVEVGTPDYWKLLPAGQYRWNELHRHGITSPREYWSKSPLRRYSWFSNLLGEEQPRPRAIPTRYVGASGAIGAFFGAGLTVLTMTTCDTAEGIFALVRQGKGGMANKHADRIMKQIEKYTR